MSVPNIRSLMDERHDVAKNRERLLYQMKVPNVKELCTFAIKTPMAVNMTI